MGTSTRHDALLRHLRRNGAVTVAALADHVGTSRRTVLRDIGALREVGFLIDTEPGRGGGVRLDPRSANAGPRLGVTELFALIVSVASMRAAGSLPFADHADGGLAKLERAMAPEAVRDLRDLLARLHFGQLSPLQPLDDLGPIVPALLPAFEAGFLERRYLRFDYRDARGRWSERTVEPQAMLVLPPLWYLVAYDPMRDDFRHFRMDRIAAPQVLPDRRFRLRHVPFEDDVCPFAELERRAAQAS